MLLNITALSFGVLDEMKQWLLIFLLALGVLLTGLIVFLLIKELISGGYVRHEANEAQLQSILEPEKVTSSAASSPTAASPTKNDESEIVAAIMGAISAHTGKPMTAFKVIRFQERV